MPAEEGPRLGWWAIRYFACRVCGKSPPGISRAREIVAVLDEGMTDQKSFNGEVLRVNWLLLRSLFDFERVEIVRASPYEVERFCIQVVNDGDLDRRRRYRKMDCVVDKQSGLPPQTLNMLKAMFRRVILR